MVFRVRTLNAISPVGIARFPDDRYEVGDSVDDPDAFLVRSADMHGLDMPLSLKAVGRAGVGVNNIPIDDLSGRGIPVFNAPGANANAVKELVIAGILLAARHIVRAWDFVRTLDVEGEALTKAVESGKKKFVGFELPGKTLGVVGLGAVGVEVANAALALGMRVIGFDPAISVTRAWQLSAGVQQAANVETLFADADIVTLHVPLTESTKGMVDAKLLGWMRRGGVLLNFSRDQVVDEPALLDALESGSLDAYVTDFPTSRLKDHPAVTALPHLGASTGEAEENSAAMVAESLRLYLEEGNVRHSVNFPEAMLPLTAGERLCIVNANVPGMVGQISTALAEAHLNISDMFNASRGDLAYTLVDIEGTVPESTFEAISVIEGVTRARLIRRG